MSKKKRKKKAKKPPEPTDLAFPVRKAFRVPIKPKVGRPVSVDIEGDDATLLGLRYAAGRDYACTFRNLSIEELAKRPMYVEGGVNVKTMQYWCRVDGWVAHRRAFQEEYRSAIERALASQIVMTRKEYLDKGKQGLDLLFAKFLPEDPELQLEPTSLEALANATRQFWDKYIDEAEKLADTIVPESVAAQQQTETALPTVKPQLSQAEAKAAALTVVRMRREEQRAALRAKEAQEGTGEEEAPHMRVIQGEK